MVSVVIDPRFRGLEGIALGGYVGGRLAGERAAEVTLLRPTPVGRPLRLEDREDGTTVLLDGGAPLASARPLDFDLDVPAPVPLEVGAEAAVGYCGFRRHLFPGCFVCGPERAEGDGLRIFPGAVPGRDLVAAPWTPDRSLADGDRTLAPEFLWSAVDCPSIWALIHCAAPDSGERVVTARRALRPLAPVPVGKPCVVTGWAIGAQGRFRIAGAAVHSAEGRLLAVARHTLATTDWGVPLSPSAWGLDERALR